MRCFIGIPVAPALAVKLMAAPLPPTARPVLKGNLHLTLAFLGERRWQDLHPLLPELETALTPVPTFTVALSALNVFPEPGGRIWAAHALREPSLLDLHHQIRGVLGQAGIEAEPRRFLPHVTLGRSAAPLRAKAELGPWGLPVNSVMLYESPPDGDYRVLREWPLKK